MPQSVTQPLTPRDALSKLLESLPRRYRVPAYDGAALTALAAARTDANPAAVLAITIEQACQIKAADGVPGAELQARFIGALEQLLREAMRPHAGDPVFQAMVLRHHAPQVREFASLRAHAARDRRELLAAINALAHPGKQQRLPAGPWRTALARLHEAGLAALQTPLTSWPQLADAIRVALTLPEVAADRATATTLQQLLESAAGARLRRLDALSLDSDVRHYQTLWDRIGPRSGSPRAIAQGAASHRRGAAVEARTQQALEALARRLEATQPGGFCYRVVTSMRVPAAIPAATDHAKTEWDAVLLCRPRREGGAATPHSPVPGEDPANAALPWDVCLLVEAKACADAAATDLPRLLRGLQVLARADVATNYRFSTHQGEVVLRGASLCGLRADAQGVAQTVLYCCDAPPEDRPRLLGAASRMQLLSTPASLAFASALAQGHAADAGVLQDVWQQLLDSPQWAPVLQQYAALRQGRAMMVSVDDLLAVGLHAGGHG